MGLNTFNDNIKISNYSLPTFLVSITRLIFLCIFSTTCLLPNLHALEGEVVSASHLKMQLVSGQDAYRTGEPFTIALRAVPEVGWHIYWKNPGDSGSALAVDWSTTFGAEINGPEFPIPARIPTGPLLNYGYETETFFLFEVIPRVTDDSALKLRADVEILVCKEECIPANALLEVIVNSSTSNTKSETVSNNLWKEKLKNTANHLAFDYPSVTLTATNRDAVLELNGQLPSNKGESHLTFFPITPLLIINSANQELLSKNGKFSLKLSKHSKAEPRQLEGILVSSMGWTPESPGPQAIKVNLPIEGETAEKMPDSIFGFLLTILFALLGGLILNLMPCVFPILTLKIFSIVSQNSNSQKNKIKQSVAFTLGSISTFLVLAISILAARSSGEAIGWGFQLQSPGFVASLASLTFIVSLNFLGVFEFGTAIQRFSGKLDSSKSSKNQTFKSFVDGVLMTTLSTPCTAPFMGTALAYGLSAPLPKLFAVFTALGLGMAFPFVLLTHSPKLLSYLPKPGNWMETFKTVLAFPLFATTLWLLWVLGLQSGVNVLVSQLSLLLLLSFFLWIYGKYSGPRTSKLKRRLILAITLLVLALSFLRSANISSAINQNDSISWEKYSQNRLTELLNQNRIVYVDFTAAWCITCQVNKIVALSTSSVSNKLKELNVATLEADWTNKDPEITRALMGFGREGVPLNVIYSKSLAKVEILPQVLTSGIVLEALDRASSEPER